MNEVEINQFNEQTKNPNSIWLIVSNQFSASGCFIAFPHKEWAEKYASGLNQQIQIVEYAKK